MGGATMRTQMAIYLSLVEWWRFKIFVRSSVVLDDLFASSDVDLSRS